jgi:hypothetical protein
MKKSDGRPATGGDGAPDAQAMIDCVEAYFASADRCDIAATLAAMTPDCVMEYLTEGLRYEGRDEGIRQYFEARANKVLECWHGNFWHVADPARSRVATRFEVRRSDRGAIERTGDNVDLFQFEGRRIKRITVWKSAGTAGTAKKA